MQDLLLVYRFFTVLDRWGNRFYHKKIEEYGLPIQAEDVSILMQIYLHPGLSLATVEKTIGFTKAEGLAHVRDLEMLGIVNVRKDEATGDTHLFVTKKGMEIRGPVYRMVADLHEILYHGLPSEGIQRMIEDLIQMKNNLLACLDEDEEQAEG